MIGYLDGTVKAIDHQRVLVNVGQIGYWVTVPSQLIAQLPIGSACELFIHTHHKEDSMMLYGFSQLGDLRLFEQLITVSGVGPKLGLNVFTAGNAAAITQAIEEANQNFFTGISGIGKKNAQRLIIDLKGKVGQLGQALDLSGSQSPLLAALINLGFTQPEIKPVLSQIDTKLPPEEQVKLALKLLG